MTAKRTTPTIVTAEVRDALDARRAALGITASQLAAMLFLNESTMRQVLSGHRDLKVAVAAGLRKAIDYLEKNPRKIINKRPGLVTSARAEREDRENRKVAACAT